MHSSSRNSPSAKLGPPAGGGEPGRCLGREAWLTCPGPQRGQVAAGSADAGSEPAGLGPSRGVMSLAWALRPQSIIAEHKFVTGYKAVNRAVAAADSSGPDACEASTPCCSPHAQEKAAGRFASDLARVPPPYHHIRCRATAKGFLPPGAGVRLCPCRWARQGPRPECRWVSRKMHLWSRGRHMGMALAVLQCPPAQAAGTRFCVPCGGVGTDLLSWQCRDQGTCWASGLEVEGTHAEVHEPEK